MTQKSADQNRDIFLPFTQRRHRDAHDIQPEKEIVAEFSLAHELFEVLVRRCDQPHVCAQRLVAAHSFERASFAHHAQQFDLNAQIDLRHFIEKNCAAVGLFEPTDAPFMRPGKRAFFVPE